MLYELMSKEYARPKLSVIGSPENIMNQFAFDSFRKIRKVSPRTGF